MICKVKVQGRDVTWCIWQVLTHKSKTQKNIEIGKVAHPTGNIAHLFQSQRSKVKVSSENESVSYLRRGKAYELHNWYADGACYQLPQPAI